MGTQGLVNINFLSSVLLFPLRGSLRSFFSFRRILMASRRLTSLAITILLNGVDVAFGNIHPGNFKRLHYRILMFFPWVSSGRPISSTYSLREHCSNSATFFSKSTVLLLTFFFESNATLSRFSSSI